jgi:hypothetical protein
LLLVTNAHVVNADGATAALQPQSARVSLQGLGATVECGNIVWSSPVEALDATVLELKTYPSAAVGLPLSDTAVTLARPPQPVYIIGHPGGRAIELSIHDNKLVRCKEPKLHYRAPTEGGSSGSPVFDALQWKVIALHHSAVSDANEGISIQAIRKAMGNAG